MKIIYGPKAAVEFEFEEFIALQSCNMLDGVVELLVDLDSANTECSCMANDKGCDEDDVYKILMDFFRNDNEGD